ncbi:aspartyl-phosphate phosphatase Spo0E family protein [Virgibacillus dokdonensis]|uniref:Aspartyl-phosphate phosphatase Spo0E family protein n=1 Tax=Virgibacillus dokdonensis TaxID=302167 RepID=A0A2K9J074_9BACI|nr:aspartyl-phosphate phosphatase Spo0E family protein [Virgibacillus dokdonensis]AUJ25357.1 Spo0E like sporulation regulatory protein [Virgibacillus dokdonensis]
MKVIDPNPSRLAASIHDKKKEMITLGLKYGLTDRRTVKCSQQLDKLLNLHNSLRPFYVASFTFFYFLA